VTKQQSILGIAGLSAILLLFFFGKTTPEKKETPKQASEAAHKHEHIQFSDLLTKAKQRLNPNQLDSLQLLEKQLSTTEANNKKAAAYFSLASFWKNSGKIFEPYVYYFAEGAKLENSEKNLTFAARQFSESLIIEGDPAMQEWLATNAKDLYEKALEINPANDSAKIGLGACYILGGISDNPMQGILPVKEIADKNPNNTYAQFILALGGKKSGQYDKAIDRFSKIVALEPQNLEVKLHLAECYELSGNFKNAIKWYNEVKMSINNEAAKKELDSRIQMLKQKGS